MTIYKHKCLHFHLFHFTADSRFTFHEWPRTGFIRPCRSHHGHGRWIWYVCTNSLFDHEEGERERERDVCGLCSQNTSLPTPFTTSNKTSKIQCLRSSKRQVIAIVQRSSFHNYFPFPLFTQLPVNCSKLIQLIGVEAMPNRRTERDRNKRRVKWEWSCLHRIIMPRSQNTRVLMVSSSMEQRRERV